MSTKLPPLIVDLDKTLVRTDTLVESILLLVKTQISYIFLVPLWLFLGRSKFKSKINAKVNLPVELLPYNQELIHFIKKEKQKGRIIVLATASHTNLATKVASHLGLFDLVLGSDEHINLKGVKKLEKIQEEIGEKFSYAGDSKADVPIWDAAQSTILVNVNSNIRARYKKSKLELEITHPKASLGEWIKAIRLHQWVKNSLVFVPLLVSFSFEEVSILKALLASLALSLLASSTYIFNDLFDLFSDRAHRSKKNRPLAASKIPIESAITIMFVLATLSVLIALQVNTLFLLILFAYFVMTISYSLVLKKYVLLDTITLSLLFTVRIIAGSAAIGIPTSEWLLAFSVFMFLSLALVKRCSELVVLKASEKERSRGRDYQVSDLAVLWPLGVGSAISSIAIFCQYISDPMTQARYTSPELLWLATPALIYWLSRLWIKTSRGEMHDDPIVYAFSNRGSFLTLTFVLVIVVSSHVINIQA